MECGILLIFPLIHLLLVRAADVNDVDTQVKAGNVETLNECYWSGEGPICDGKCRAGETVASESKKNDGHGCIIGKKMYCCKGGLSNNTTELAAAAGAPHHVKRQHENQVTNSSAGRGGQLPLGDTKDDCYWVGKSPNCKGSCLEGDYMVNTSRTANGSTCIVGKKKYCCKGSGTNNTLNNVPAHSNTSTTEPPPTNTVHKQMMNGNSSSSSCYWVGKAPICLGSCKLGDYVAEKSPTGDGGEKCESGQKKFCCARQQSTATTQEPPRQPTTAIGQQMDKVVNNSISNWTIGPFQARRRPTPRGLPINSTVTNRVKIVKIKRKLVMSTPTAENASTSISMSETWSTLAMASLLTLPSTTESAATTTATTATTESTTTVTTESTTAATTTSESTTTTATATTESTTTPTESTTASTTTTTTATATPIPTTLATRSTSAATESTSVATAWPSTPAASSTSMKPTTSSAPKKFTPFFDLPDVLPVPLIFRIQKSANAEISPASATPSIIQSSTTSVATTTPTTLE